MAFGPFLSVNNLALESFETLCRTADGAGNRSYQQFANTNAAPLCDEQGRLIVRQAGQAGFESAPTTSQADTYGEIIEAGSAPSKGAFGQVIVQRVMQRARFFDATTAAGAPYITRCFGWANIVGWVQFHLRDESAGANPPVGGEIPEVSIAVPVANTEFEFSNYRIASAAVPDFATYITFSTTGPTYTAAGAPALWFYFLGYL